MSKTPPGNEMKYSQYTALAYARVSSLQQATEGHGLDGQAQRGLTFAVAHGANIDKNLVFEDILSGKTDYIDRPGFMKMYHYVEDHPGTKFVITVDDLTRVARGVQAHLRLRTALRQLGVDIISPNFNFEDTEEGEMVENIMASTSQYHQQSNRRQVIQKMQARLMDGYWPFAPKTGYETVKEPGRGKLSVPSCKGINILKPAIEGFASGVFVRRIDACAYLVQQGFWTKQSPEKYIDKFTNIIKDPFYAGYIEYSGVRPKNKGRKKTHKEVNWA